MTTKPTAEQIEAAKAYARGYASQESLQVLVSWTGDPTDPDFAANAAQILLAALEAAEARILELEEEVENLGYEVKDANERSAE